MARKIPRKHHFIPQMILKNFSNAKGQVWVNDGAGTYLSQIKDVFAIRDLNAKWDWSDIPVGTDYEGFLASVPRTDEYELVLGKIESEAEPVITAIIEQARCPNRLVLEPQHRDILKRFMFASARRTPEAQNRTAIFSLGPEVFYEAAKATAERKNLPPPNKESFAGSPQVRRIRDKMLSNSRAGFAAGVHPFLKEEELKFAPRTGVAVAVIRERCNEFVLGSHGVTLLERSLLQYLPAVSWLPVAPDIAIGVTTYPDWNVAIELSAHNGGTEIVSLINHSTAVLSERIVGESEALVRSMK